MRKLACVAALAALLALGCDAWKRRAYESPDRDEWQHPEKVVAALGIRPGDRIADLGAGSGYFTVRLAEAVGPSGRVYAVDVDEDMNEYLRGRVKEAGFDNVEVILGTYTDPLLPDGQIDVFFTSNTYHHLEGRSAYFRDVQQDLAPGGRVAVVDFDGRKGWFVRLVGHYTEKEVLLSEMAEAGYRVEQDHEFLDRQSFVVFRVDGG